MAVVALTATKRPGGTMPSQALAGVPQEQVAVVTTNADDSANSTYTMFTMVPMSARVMPQSVLENDDLASSGAPTLDIGIFAEDGQFTDDDDALNDGLAGTTAGTKDVIKDHADSGKQLWEFVNGLTENPGGFATIKLTLKDAAINQAGDISMLLRLVHE